MGTKFEVRVPTTEKPVDKVIRAKLLTSLEDMVFDSIVEWECPTCGEVRSLEPDARGKFTCDGCQQKLYAENPLF